MSEILSEDDEEHVCPLCVEPFPVVESSFYPCSCGYQVCVWCWSKIKDEGNNLCPACRTPYQEKPAEYKPLSSEDLQKIEQTKKQKILKKKQDDARNRRALREARVIQKNLVYVVGIAPSIASEDELKKPERFGQFGTIVKIVVNQNNNYINTTYGPSATAYVTYSRPEEASRAIEEVDGAIWENRPLKAYWGTTKYCTYFLRHVRCPNPECMYLHEFGEEAVRPSPRQGSSSSFAPTGGRVSRAYGRDIRQPYPYENGMKFMENSDWEDPESGPPSLFLSGKVQHLAFSRNHKSAGLKRNLPSYSSGLKQAPGYGGGTNPAKSESGVQLGPSPSTDKHVNLSSRQAPQKHYSNETRLKVCGLTDPWGGVAAERQKSAESYLRSGNIKNNSCINSTKLHFPYNRASSSTSTFTAPLLPHINKSKSLLLSAIPASKPKYNHTPSTTVSSVNFRKENAASAPPLTASVGSPRKPAWGLSFQSPVVKGTDSNTRVLLAPKTTRKFRKVVAMSPTSTFIPPLASEKAQLVKIMTNEVVSTLPSRQLSENISAQMGAGEVSIVKNNCSRAPCMLGGETINESGVVSNDLTPVSHNKTSENAHVVCKGSNTSNSNGQPETLKVTNDNCSTKHNYSVGKTIDPSFNENNSNDFSNCDINFELDAFQAPQEINDLLSDGLDVGLLIQQQLDQHRHRQHRSEYPPPENQAGGWPVMDNNAQALQYPFNLPPFSGNPSALSFNHSCCFRAPKEGVRSGGSYRKSDVNFPALINDDDLSVACCERNVTKSDTSFTVRPPPGLNVDTHLETRRPPGLSYYKTPSDSFLPFEEKKANYWDGKCESLVASTEKLSLTDRASGFKFTGETTNLVNGENFSGEENRNNSIFTDTNSQRTIYDRDTNVYIKNSNHGNKTLNSNVSNNNTNGKQELRQYINKDINSDSLLFTNTKSLQDNLRALFPGIDISFPRMKGSRNTHPLYQRVGLPERDLYNTKPKRGDCPSSTESFPLITNYLPPRYSQHQNYEHNQMQYSYAPLSSRDRQRPLLNSGPSIQPQCTTSSTLDPYYYNGLTYINLLNHKNSVNVSYNVPQNSEHSIDPLRRQTDYYKFNHNFSQTYPTDSFLENYHPLNFPDLSTDSTTTGSDRAHYNLSSNSL